jgi:hypothetical protein
MFLGLIIALSLVLLLQAIEKHKAQRGAGGEGKRGR